MAKGAIAKLAADREEAKARQALAGKGGNYFRVGQDEEETVRILENLDAATAAFFHELENPKPKRPPLLEICLDQDDDGNRTGESCPGCEMNAEDYEVARRKLVMYLNVIWRDAPERKKNDKGKYEETGEKADTLAIWEVRQKGIKDALEDSYLTYKDLTSRDFVVRRKGTGFDTTYTLNPAVNEDGDAVKSPMSKDDKELDEKKPDLSTRVEKKDASDWGKVSKKSDSKDEEEESESPFLKRNKKSEGE